MVSWGCRTRSVPLNTATHSRANAGSLGASLILHLNSHVSTGVVLSPTPSVDGDPLEDKGRRTGVMVRSRQRGQRNVIASTT